MAEVNLSTRQDDVVNRGATEEEMLADIMRNSEIAQQAGVAPPPIVESQSDTPSGSEEIEDVEEDLEDSIDSAEEDDVEPDEEVEEVEEETDEDAAATQEGVYSLDDLEDFSVTHKIDGEEVTLPISEWVAGSATKQHLSKQGRELGEARKQLEAEREEKLGAINNLGAFVAQQAYSEELKHQEEYNKVTQEINKAEDDDDTFRIGELTKKQKDAQRKYLSLIHISEPTRPY